jgi:Protein of unknown function (DUF1091)
VFRCNTEIFGNCTFIVFNGSDGLSRFNGSFLLEKTLSAVVTTYTIKLRKDSQEYDFVFNQGTVDACKVQRGVVGSIFVKFMMDSITDETSNYRFQCPQLPGFYYLRNFPTMDLRHVPRIFLTRQEWEFTSTVRTKVKGSKKLEFAGTAKVTGFLI